MTALGLALLAAGAYLILCAADPDATCWRCRGYGTAPLLRWRTCRRCGGTGLRRRFGARLWRRR